MPAPTTADLEAAEDEQLAALEAARDAVVAAREGRISNAARIAAMRRLEEADAKVLDVKHHMVTEAARILGGKVIPGRRK